MTKKVLIIQEKQFQYAFNRKKVKQRTIKISLYPKMFLHQTLYVQHKVEPNLFVICSQTANARSGDVLLPGWSPATAAAEGMLSCEKFVTQLYSITKH